MQACCFPPDSSLHAGRGRSLGSSGSGFARGIIFPVMKNAKRVSPKWAVSFKLSKACYCSWKSDTRHQHPLKLSGQARFLLTLLLKLLKPLWTRLAFTYHWYSWGFYIRAKELPLTQWSRGTFKSPESFWLQMLLICSLQASSVQ